MGDSMNGFAADGKSEIFPRPFIMNQTGGMNAVLRSGKMIRQGLGDHGIRSA